MMRMMVGQALSEFVTLQALCSLPPHCLTQPSWGMSVYRGIFTENLDLEGGMDCGSGKAGSAAGSSEAGESFLLLCHQGCDPFFRISEDSVQWLTLLKAK